MRKFIVSALFAVVFSASALAGEVVTVEGKVSIQGYFDGAQVCEHYHGDFPAGGPYHLPAVYCRPVELNWVEVATASGQRFVLMLPYGRGYAHYELHEGHMQNLRFAVGKTVRFTGELYENQDNHLLGAGVPAKILDPRSFTLLSGVETLKGEVKNVKFLKVFNRLSVITQDGRKLRLTRGLFTDVKSLKDKTCELVGELKGKKSLIVHEASCN